MSGLIITDHAADRFRERTGLPKRLVTKTAQKALEQGITAADTVGQLRRYLDGLYLAHRSANNIRAYCGRVYIFHFDTLITVYDLPNNLRKQAEKAQRRKQQG